VQREAPKGIDNHHLGPKHGLNGSIKVLPIKNCSLLGSPLGGGVGATGHSLALQYLLL